MKYLLLILALVTLVFANRGRQITIWNPLETSPVNSPITSFRPTNIFSGSTLRRDHLFTPALSQDNYYQNPPHCGFGHEMYCNGKYFNYTLDGGQKYWGYDEFQNGLNYADGYSYGNGYDYDDGAYYQTEELLGQFPQHHSQKVNSALNIPTAFQSGENRDLYVKLSHFWQNLDNQTPLPLDQCYTVYLDVRSTSGFLAVGLATRQMLNGHNHGFGHPLTPVAYNDTFVGFYRSASVSQTTTGGFLTANLLDGTTVVGQTLNQQSFVECTTSPCTITTNFRVTVEVCNQTTVHYQETTPLGATPSTHYSSSSAVYNVDLRGNGIVRQSIDVALYGEDGTNVFVVSAKVVPKVYQNNDRVQYSTVMDGSQLNPTTFSPNTFEIASNAVFSNNQLSFTSNVNYNEQTEPEELDDHQELVCFALSGLSSGKDYIVDIGLFSEHLPLELSGNQALAIGLRQGSQFIGFNRLGFYSDSLGNVITANVSGNLLKDVVRQDRVFQNRPSNGIVQNSGLTAPHFNVKFSVYGSLNAGVSVFAGTFDSPPYTLVWAAVEQPHIDFNSPVDLCFYHQAEAAEDLWTPDPTNQWKNITTILNGLTVSVENAQFGCDGKDLSGTVVDSCGVCGGNNECVGCDGTPFSSATLDGCGFCGGQNITCCTNRFGISDKLWDWLLLPHIIEDVTQRLNSLSTQLATTCSLLDSFSNLCGPVSSGLLNAFNDIDLAKHQTELKDFQQNCLNNLHTSVTEMIRDVSVWVPLENYGGNL